MTKFIELAGLLLNDVADNMTVKEYKEYLRKYADDKNKQEQQKEVDKKEWYANAEKLNKCFKTIDNSDSITYMHCFPANPNNRDNPEVHGETINVYSGYINIYSEPTKRVSVEITEGIGNKLWLPNPYEVRFTKCKAKEISLEEYNRVRETYAKMEEIINKAIKNNESIY